MPKCGVIGNWKMNQSLEEIQTFFNDLKFTADGGTFGIVPQALHIQKCLELAKGSGLQIGSQNISEHDNGAFTGELSAQAVKEIGAGFTLVGHSERRSLYGETNQIVNEKVIKALSLGLTPVLCIGESLEQRESGQTFDIVLSQIKEGLKSVSIDNVDQLVLAYEPVWAIGTGKTASPEQAQEVHAKIRALLIEIYPSLGNEMSILYGGSVKPSNIKYLLSQKDINGGLVGGASLTAQSFSELCEAADFANK